MTKDFSRQRPSAYDYIRAKNFTNMVRKSTALTPEQKRTLHSRAVHGDVEGALEEYERMLTDHERGMMGARA